VYKGLEGLAATNRLLQAARVYAPNCVLREELYRVALDEQQRDTLRTTAKTLPELTTWMDDEGECSVNDDTLSSGPALGALKLYNGCHVVHVPTYLQGLWKACQSIGNGSTEWIHSKEPKDHNDGKDHAAWKEQLSNYSCVVFAAGAGMFQASMFEGDPSLPIQLVRGQSVEMTVRDNPTMDALLCGKYISPMLEANKVLVGATHEFKEEPLSEDDVVKELRDRSYDFASSLWDHGSVDRITTGYRVQSQRGRHGRLPIIGQYQSQHHPNAWIFTGLSSRGLLYHGIYGERLSEMILGETTSVGDDAEIETNWWRS
jgi:glycine/D-amino acid oxidase-like deaminating enzyme